MLLHMDYYRTLNTHIIVVMFCHAMDVKYYNQLIIVSNKNQ